MVNDAVAAKKMWDRSIRGADPFHVLQKEKKAARFEAIALARASGRVSAGSVSPSSWQFS